MPDQAIQVIMQLTGRNKKEAQAFCQNVLAHCATTLPFSAIAEALTQCEFSKTTIKDLAHLASSIHQQKLAVSVQNIRRNIREKLGKNIRSNCEPAHKIVTDSQAANSKIARAVMKDKKANSTPVKLGKRKRAVADRTHAKSSMVSATKQNDEDIQAYDARPQAEDRQRNNPPSNAKTVPGFEGGAGIFNEYIGGRVLGFTGEGPYNSTHLEEFASRNGAVIDNISLPWSRLEWVVLGRENFYKEYVEKAAQLRHVRFFSQEEFLGLVVLSANPLVNISMFEQNHDGVSYLMGLPAPKWSEESSLNDQRTIELGDVSICDEYSASAPAKLATVPCIAPPDRFTQTSIPPKLSVQRNEVVMHSRTQPSSPFVRQASSQVSNETNLGISRQPFSTLANTEAQANFPNIKLPRTASVGGKSDEQLKLRVESDLKRLGYHAFKGSSRTHRKLALQKGVEQLGLQAVLDHLAFLIRFHRGKNLMRNAVALWQEDIEWLKRAFRKNII